MRIIPAPKPPRCAHQAVPPLPTDSAAKLPTPLIRFSANQIPIMSGAGTTAGTSRMMGEKDAHQGARKEQQVGAEDGGDGPAGADHRHEVAGVDPDVSGGGGVSADEVEDGESPTPQAILDARAEHPEEKHVADDVEPTGVQEHGGERCEQQQDAVEEIDPAAAAGTRESIEAERFNPVVGDVVAVEIADDELWDRTVAQGEVVERRRRIGDGVFAALESRAGRQIAVDDQHRRGAALIEGEHVEEDEGVHHQQHARDVGSG